MKQEINFCLYFVLFFPLLGHEGYIGIHRLCKCRLNLYEFFHSPCAETARDLAKSILLATRIIGRVLIKSISCRRDRICLDRVNDSLSTTEYTTRYASAFSNSSCNKKRKKILWISGEYLEQEEYIVDKR